jgi:hypothetical protein
MEVPSHAGTPGLKVYAHPDSPKQLGEAILEALAQGHPIQVLCLTLHELPALGHRLISAARIEALLASGTRLPTATPFYMPNGDLFLTARRFTAESLRQLCHLLAADVEVADPDTISGLCQIFELPDDAIPLRKLIKAHLAGSVPGAPPPAETREVTGADPPGGRQTGRDGRLRPEPRQVRSSGGGGQGAQPVALEGPLTLELLQQLRRLLDQIDLAPFIEQQTVYAREPAWRACYVEHFFDISRLRQSYFPRVDLTSSESLFVQFTRDLDDLMLVQVLGSRLAQSGPIGLNLSVATVESPTFDQISAHLSAEERQHVVCELHWIEFLQDIQSGGGAVRRLAERGYRLALDRIGATVLPCLDLRASAVDFIKVPFDRPTMARIEPATITALKRCDPGKLVLTSCEDRRAVALGEALGIRNFQGRLIDQMARERAA